VSLQVVSVSRIAKYCFLAMMGSSEHGKTPNPDNNTKFAQTQGFAKIQHRGFPLLTKKFFGGKILARQALYKYNTNFSNFA
jgi:hypothetical protein